MLNGAVEAGSGGRGSGCARGGRHPQKAAVSDDRRDVAESRWQVIVRDEVHMVGDCLVCNAAGCD